ncbi:MAG: hypothetical protein ACREQA_12505 [Candidatus Binatia bacterium]
MIDEALLLQDKFSQLLRWERVKRREKIILAVFFYSVLISLSLLIAKGLLPSWVSPLSLPVIFFLVLAPGFFLMRPWGSRESLRAVFVLDKALHLEERAVTAWEILSRKEKKAAELLVLKEAGEGLKEVDPKVLFKRHLTWHAFFAPPLLLLWLLLVWLDIGGHSWRKIKSYRSASVAQKLKDFSHDLQERAKSQGLTQSLKMAQALDEVAEKSLRGEMSEKKLGEDLTGMVNEVEDMGRGAAEESDLPFPTATTEGLLDLKAELETLKHPLTLPGSARQEETIKSDLLERLGVLPRLREAIKKGLLSVDKPGEKGLERFLDRLEKGVVAELDRRTLLEIREFLSFLLKGLEGKETGEALGETAQAEQGQSSEAERVRGMGSLPGSQLGTKGEAPLSHPFKAGAATHLKGLLGEGKSGSLTFRGEFPSKGSKIPREEAITSYRRQAEEELASERIPEGLKETIRNYFLSLGMAEEKK